MKKGKFLLAIAFILSFAFTSCFFNSKTYRVEMAEVSNEDIVEALASFSDLPDNYVFTFEDVKQIRDALYYESSDLEVSSGVFEDEIMGFFSQVNVPEQDAINIMERVDSVGNEILFFDHAYSSTDSIWMYIEVE